MRKRVHSIFHQNGSFFRECVCVCVCTVTRGQKKQIDIKLFVIDRPTELVPPSWFVYIHLYVSTLWWCVLWYPFRNPRLLVCEGSFGLEFIWNWSISIDRRFLFYRLAKSNSHLNDGKDATVDNLACIIHISFSLPFFSCSLTWSGRLAMDPIYSTLLYGRLVAVSFATAERQMNASRLWWDYSSLLHLLAVPFCARQYPSGSG